MLTWLSARDWLSDLRVVALDIQRVFEKCSRVERFRLAAWQEPAPFWERALAAELLQRKAKRESAGYWDVRDGGHSDR